MDDSVFEIASKAFQKRFVTADFLEWCQRYIRIPIRGALVPFSLEGHEYMREIFALGEVPRLTFQKAAQMIISTYCLLRSLYLMDRYAMKVVYYFPTDEDVQDFSQDRCNTIIDNSDHLSEKMRYDRADNLGLKQMGNSSLYFRGVWTKRKVKSIDADMLVKDEIDEADQENLIFAEDRLLHSHFGWILELSQPSRPDYGINRSFKASDQRYWHVKCPACGRWNNVVESFPRNLMHKGKGEKLTAWVGCTHCRRKLDTTRGVWVPKYPDRSKEHVGFLPSQLFSSTVTPTFIYNKLLKAVLSSEKKNLWISIVGVPYRDSEMCPFTSEFVTEAEGKHGFEKRAHSSFMGIDVGDVCHVSVWGWTGARLRLIHCEEVLADDEARFHHLIETFNSFFVIDAMPYKNLSKRLCLKYPGWGAMQYFKGAALTEKTEGDDEYEVPVVMHDRTESIDEMAGLFKEGFFEFPNPKLLKPGESEVYERFTGQLKNLEKEKVPDKHGYEQAVYKKKVANHFGMSMNSAFIAFRIGKGHFVPSVDPIFG
ncbi:MAG: terminase [Spirochaetes bacterium]|nr:MAG: terminase [Spirochaetota bacterium]